jgi:uncharacterized membrane protein SpoIIM required for sporulation
MVVESVLKIEVERKPEEMLIFGFIVSSLAIVLSLWVFPAYASFAMVTFTVMAILPFIVRLMKFETDKQEHVKYGSRIKVHRDVIFSFIFLFIGILLAFTLWFLLLPSTLAGKLFFLQINTITEINTPTGKFFEGMNFSEGGYLDNEAGTTSTGLVTGPVGATAKLSGAASVGSSFKRIFLNNLRILSLCVLFSFIFGSGAIFILTWNASVLGVAVGNAIRLGVAGGGGSATYFGAISFALIRYMMHGLPEITAYFLGGLAGAVIGFTILEYKVGLKGLSDKLGGSLKDAISLVLLGVVLLLIAALIEILISPLFV